MKRIRLDFGKTIRSLAFKSLIALTAAALPALAVASILGLTLVTAVSEAETDFDNAISSSRRLTEIRVLIETEHGLVTRLPAELDLGRIDGYSRQIAVADQRIDAEIAALASNGRIVSPEVVAEMRAKRKQMKETTAQIVNASRAFAQTTALELVDTQFEEDAKVVLALLDAIGSNVDGVVNRARHNLQAGARWAWRLTPAALIGALLAVACGIMMFQRSFVGPVTNLSRHVLRIRESGNLDLQQDNNIPQRGDEIGTLSRSFSLMISELAEARKRMIEWSETEIRKQYERLTAAINNMPQGLCMFDAEQKLIVCNKRYTEIYGLSAEHSVAGTPLRTMLDDHVANGRCPENVEDYVDSRLAAVRQNEPYYHINELRSGHVIAISYQPMSNGGSIATHEDITERRKVEAKIAYMAHHDALTDLPNRTRFRAEMLKVLPRTERGELIAVLCIDLDHFKTVNDTLGHPIGDALLQAVSARLRACLRPTDTVARLGGDEFAIVQVGGEQALTCSAIATRIINELSQPFDVHGHQIVIGASVGIAIAPDDGADPDRLMKNADMALYRAKEDGRGTYRFFESDMDTRMQARRALELDLRKALALKEFEVFYQPLVNLTTNDISGFEALLRWRHPERGMVPPAEFIPLAEEIGLIGPIGVWVLKEVCAEAARWPDNIRFAVNLSPAQFKNQTLVLDVAAALGASGVAAHRLELEITEAVLLQESEMTNSILNDLRSLGVRISMDDFGTGYSSLGYLRRFPFDKIKIDRSFIRDLTETRDSMAIVRAVTGLGNSLGIATTAEGVETQEQLDQLRREGCTEVQGYFLGKPKPASELDSLLRSTKLSLKAVA